ncbi:MAG: FHA domain-containing protein [Actinobacteria bacterium]|nr:MAG: FHA domain-containing protein [Actinomycetota bacterium]
MYRKTAFFSTGAGLAASIAHASLFIASDIASDPARDLLMLFRESAATSPDSVGIVRALARVVAQHGFESVPAFACVISGETDVHAIVYGQLQASVRTTHNEELLDGSLAITWADRRFAGTLVDFAVGESLDPASSWFFAEGIVPASGMLVSAAVDIPPMSTAVGLDDVVESGRVAPLPSDFIDLTDSVVAAPRADVPSPLPPPPPPPPLIEASSPSVPHDSAGRAVAVAETRAVAGMPCIDGHLNRPDVTRCEWCSAELDRARGTIVGVRPSLGVLVFDDGVREIDLVRPVIVGAAPPTDVVIAGEDAETVLIDSNLTGISDTQFEVHFESWDVFVLDRSTTGTFLDDASGRRHLLPRHARVKLKPGSVLAFGDHTVRVDHAR